MIPTDVMEAVTHYLAANRDNGQDAKVIANHCLPWLDQTPITAEWLHSINGDSSGDGEPTYFDVEELQISVTPNDDTTRWSINLTEGDDDEGWNQIALPYTVTTRGQLLMLLTALGVTCKT